MALTTPRGASTPHTVPAHRRWAIGMIVLAVLVLGLVAGVLALERVASVRRWAKESFAVFVAPYAELLSAEVGRDYDSEYVVFLSGDATPEALGAFLGAHPGVRFDREGDLPRTVVVIAADPTAAGLAALRDEPYVRLLVRNRGGFFCH